MKKMISLFLIFSQIALAGSQRQLDGTTIRVGPGGGVLTLPNTTDTLVGKNTTDTLTNKSLSGASNTFTSIPNSATTATSANTVSTIVARDGSGNFSAGTVTAALAGNATTATTATNVTTNANLTGPITSVGNATSIASQTGTGTKFVVDNGPTLIAPVLGAATGTSLSVSGQLTSTVATGTAPLAVSSTTQVANLNAATAGTATNATNGTTASTSSNASFFPLFAASSSNGNQPFNLGTGLTFNPSTNSLATTTFVGALTGHASLDTQYTANQFGVVLSGSGTTMTVLAPDASTTKVLTSGGLSANPTWASVGSGTVTSVAAAGPTGIATWSAAVTTNGTLTQTLSNQNANVVLAGPTNGSAATPAFRALAPTDQLFAGDGLLNVGLSASISSSTLVVALKQADGSTDCAAGSGACEVSFRSATATTGSFTYSAFTAANSITLAANDSIGAVSGVSGNIYAYLISDGTSEICLSFQMYDDGTVQSASALTAGADVTANALWCTNAHTSRPIRLIGAVFATWSNPNWGSLTQTRIVPFSKNYVMSSGSTQRIETAQVTAKCTTATCTSSVTDGITNVTRSGTGSYSVNFRAGYFTSAPSCTISGTDSGTADGTCTLSGNTSTSAAAAVCRQITATTLQDDSFQMICIGPKGGT